MKENRGAPPVDEEALVDAARQGDREAFDRLWDIHSPRIWRLVHRVLRRTADAEAVVRDAALAADRALPAYTGEVPFALWLTRIAVLRALARLEHKPERAPRRPAFEPALDLSRLDPGELGRRLIACRRTLPGPWRAALALRDGEGLSWEDIEVVLGLPVEGARTRVARARAALLKCAAGAGAEATDDADLEEVLSGLADDDLAPKERERAEKLVASRAAARILFVNLQTVRRAGVEDEDPPPPETLGAQIRAALPPAQPPPRRRRGPRSTAAGARRPVPRIVGVAVASCAIMVFGYYVMVERGLARQLWDRFRTATMESPASAPAPSAPPAAATEPSRDGGPAPTPAAPAESISAAETSESRRDAVAPPAPRESSSAPAPASAPAAGATLPPAAQPSSVAGGTCAVTWRAPQGTPWRWTGPPPSNSTWWLGKLAERLGGRGVLEDGASPQVRITVPRAQWTALLDSLRRGGVAPRDAGEPPPSADCASVVVTSAPPSP